MRSPFRDDEEAAERTVEDLWSSYEKLGKKVARAEAEIGRAKVDRWIWTLRVVILGVTLVLAYLAGYYSSSDHGMTTCDTEPGF
jgi:hypothetical protein